MQQYYKGKGKWEYMPVAGFTKAFQQTHLAQKARGQLAQPYEAPNAKSIVETNICNILIDAKKGLKAFCLLAAAEHVVHDCMNAYAKSRSCWTARVNECWVMLAWCPYSLASIWTA